MATAGRAGTATGAGALAPVVCGQVITQDTVLGNDLVDCPEHGLVIGADDITLDLNGHTIDGSGTGSGFAGIYSPGHAHVIIRGGVVQQFSYGVALDDGSNNLITRMTARENNFGFELTGESNSTIERSQALDNAVQGFRLESGCTDSRIERNVAAGNNDGVAVLSGTANTHVERNVSRDNERSGIRISDDAAGVTITRNWLAGNGTDTDPESAGVYVRVGAGAVVSRNVALDNHGPGFFFNPFGQDPPVVPPIVLDRNDASGNTGDGFLIDTPWATLSHNRATANDGHGINAVSGVTDNGHNVAQDNALSPQCVNVICQ